MPAALAASMLAVIPASGGDGLFSGGGDVEPSGGVSLSIDSESFLAIVVAAAVASLIAALLARRVVLPVVVLEICLGIVIGPQLLDFVTPDDFIQFFANLGLGMLFFFAGYEIDFDRIRGSPLRLALLGWLMSLALAYTVGGLLALAGVVLSLLYTGSALVTTAIGTLIPILRDAGDMRTRFGTFLLAAGAIGEFGPVLLITFLLSTRSPLSSAVVLALFIVVAVIVAVLSVRGVGRGWPVLERTLETSGQLAVRLWVVITFALVALAASLGLDLLLGGFVAGMATHAALGEREVERLESKLVAVGYGFFIPFFFVVSGVKFDVDALFASATTVLKLPLFLALFVLVRGVPALVLYRGVLERRDRLALAAFCSTELPLVVAITTIAVEDGEMRSSTASALVGAAIVSTLVFPLIGLRLRRDRIAAPPGPLADEADAAPVAAG